STHALREEGDKRQIRWFVEAKNFYPRPPRGGRWGVDGKVHAGIGFLPTPSARRATPAAKKEVATPRFLPTPSARRATPATMLLRRQIWNFYPRPPRGGRRQAPKGGGILHLISTHALRE